METHKIIHDLGELTYEDLGDIAPRPLKQPLLESKPYQFLFAALVLGLVVGYFSRSK